MAGGGVDIIEGSMSLLGMVTEWSHSIASVLEHYMYECSWSVSRYQVETKIMCCDGSRSAITLLLLR
jgi:hypothetical protein